MGWNDGWTWAEVMLSISKLAWWTSLLTSILWHALAVNISLYLDADIDANSAQGVLERARRCAQDVYSQQRLPACCAPDISAWMPYALITGLLTIWWNPLMLQSQRRPGGKYAGAVTFYSIQVFSLALRWAAWSWHQSYFTLFSESVNDGLKAIHGSVGLILVLMTFLSYKRIKLEWKPPVSFRLEDKQLLPDMPEEASNNIIANTTSGPQNTWLPRKRDPPPQFPIAHLAPHSSHQPRYTQQPPTPPPEENIYRADHINDADAMDWSPSAPATYTTFNPRNHPGARSQQFINTGPSPFHGTLPAAPVAPSHRLRNPDGSRRGRVESDRS